MLLSRAPLLLVLWLVLVPVSVLVAGRGPATGGDGSGDAAQGGLP